MLKENWRSIARIEKVFDNLIIIAAFFVAYYARNSIIVWERSLKLDLPLGGDYLGQKSDYLIVLLIALLVFNLCLEFFGAYGSMRLTTPWRIFRISLQSAVIAFLAITSCLFILKLDLSRSLIGLFCFFSAIFIAAMRMLVLRFLRYWRAKGRNFRNILICGVGEQAKTLADQILKHKELGLNLLAFVDFSGKSQKFEIDRKPILKDITEFEKALCNLAIDEVMFADVIEVMPQVKEAALICAEQGVRTTMVADFFSLRLTKSAVSYFASMPLIHYQTPPGDHWELSLKRRLDFVVSLLLLIVLSPIFFLIALLILCTTGRPLIYKQKRVGLNGRVFNLYKFRSMRANAEQELPQLLDKNEMQGPVFKISDDPRVTKLGKILRRYSLDELPQLFNVLRGDMSLVGPRPPIPGEVDQYKRSDRRRLSMRPGITCTWQVGGRNEIKDFKTWVEMDLAYIDTWSLKNDFFILFKTIPAVLFGRGAN